MRERGTLPNHIDPVHLERFRATLEHFTPIPEGDWAAAIPRLSHVTIPKGGYFLREGDVPVKLAFIASGLFRMYFITDRGDERVMAFREEGRLISGFSPFSTGRRPGFSIQALEDSELLQTSFDLEDVHDSADCWKQVYVKYMELLFLEKEERERQFLSDDAESRYRAFLAGNPMLEARVPQYEIASYLGITPVALSRIRSGMSAKPAKH